MDPTLCSCLLVATALLCLPSGSNGLKCWASKTYHGFSEEVGPRDNRPCLAGECLVECSPQDVVCYAITTAVGSSRFIVVRGCERACPSVEHPETAQCCQSDRCNVMPSEFMAAGDPLHGFWTSQHATVLTILIGAISVMVVLGFAGCIYCSFMCYKWSKVINVLSNNQVQGHVGSFRRIEGEREHVLELRDSHMQ